MPRLAACGPRNDTYNDFAAAVNKGDFDYIAMWIDSEAPLIDVEQAWKHLADRDHWQKPEVATDDQVLFMTTCMETLIVADRATLKSHYGSKLQESGLPEPTGDLEKRPRAVIQKELEVATSDCTNNYEKGKRSFEGLAKLNPDALAFLKSFARTRRILNKKLT